MDDSYNICLACGICCDGGLIGFVQIEADEFIEVRKVLEIEESDTIGFFLQPCSKFCTQCTIYENRPKQCRKFECQLLQSYDSEQISFQSAIDIVHEVKLKRSVIEYQITSLNIVLRPASFYYKVIELYQFLNEKEINSSIVQNERYLLSEMKSLNVLVYQHFGVKFFPLNE